MNYKVLLGLLAICLTSCHNEIEAPEKQQMENCDGIVYPSSKFFKALTRSNSFETDWENMEYVPVLNERIKLPWIKNGYTDANLPYDFAYDIKKKMDGNSSSIQ